MAPHARAVDDVKRERHVAFTRRGRRAVDNGGHKWRDNNDDNDDDDTSDANVVSLGKDDVDSHAGGSVFPVKQGGNKHSLKGEGRPLITAAPSGASL